MDQEGVIKFRLQFREAPPLQADIVRELAAWHRLLFQVTLVGRDPQRYGGYAYGNLSRRLPAEAAEPSAHFVISGTQTAALPALTERHFATVLECHAHDNLVVAEGPVRPSSETLSHAVFYALDPDITYVFHVHSPWIWRHADALDIAATAPDVAYGTPQMADEVGRLLREPRVRDRGMLAMGGHRDGIIAFSDTARAAGLTLLDGLVQAYQL